MERCRYAKSISKPGYIKNGYGIHFKRESTHPFGEDMSAGGISLRYMPYAIMVDPQTSGVYDLHFKTCKIVEKIATLGQQTTEYKLSGNHRKRLWQKEKQNQKTVISFYEQWGDAETYRTIYW